MQKVIRLILREIDKNIQLMEISDSKTIQKLLKENDELIKCMTKINEAYGHE